MTDILRDPIWQGIGVIIALIVGLIGFYYAGRNKVWLIIAGVIIVLIIGFALGIQSQVDKNPNILAIEQVPFWISTYDGEGDSNPDCCAGRAELEYGNNANPFPEYFLNYTLSDDTSKHSYAGMAFVFKQSQNFFDYKNIEFTVIFSEGVSQVDLKFEDIAQTKQPFRLVGSADSANTFVIPFSNFTAIDFKAIHAISFQVDSTFASGSGKFKVKNIRLTK